MFKPSIKNCLLVKIASKVIINKNNTNDRYDENSMFFFILIYFLRKLKPLLMACWSEEVSEPFSVKRLFN